DKNLAHVVRTSRPERDPHINLTRSPICLGEQMVRDIRTRDQNNESDSDQQRPEQEADLRSVRALQEWIGMREEIAVGRRVLRGKCLADRLEFRPRLLHRDAVGEAARGKVASRLAWLLKQRWGHRA